MEKTDVLRSMAKLAVGCIAMLAGSVATAATLLETTQQVASTAAADAGLPQPLDIQITTAGSYTLTLTDLQTPEALGSLSAIVVRDLQVVATAAVVYPTGGSTPPTPATASFVAATPGTYRIHVLPRAAEGAPGGGYGISVAPTAGGAEIASDADVVAAATDQDSDQSVLRATFEITAAGTYQLSIVDHAFPAALSSSPSPQVLLLRQTSGAPEVELMAPGSFVAQAGSSYELFVIASADASAGAGLYTVSVSSGSGDAYRSTQPVGTLPPAIDVSIATAGQHTLTITDAQFPAALDALGAAVVQNHAVLGTTLTAGATTFTAASGTVQLYSFGAAGASGGVGAYTRRVEQGTQVILADTQIVDASAEPTTPAIFAFSTSAALAAGSYRLRVEDFAFPLSFPSLRAVVTHGTTLSTVLQGEGDLNLTLPAGQVKVLVAATPPAATGNALFGITLSSNTVVLESTQGVGGLFRSDTVSIPAAGPYDITLADLQFPASLQTAVLAITRGTTLVAQVIGGGTVPRQQLSPGTYVLNFLGRPATASEFGAYGIRVADSPPTPTVTLTAASSSVTSGQSTTLQWTATNATSCTAANGWSGAKAAAGGSESVGPLTANTTFDLTCTGPGGSASASAAVSVTAPSASGGRGGGGGAMGLIFVALLGAARMMRTERRGLADHAARRSASGRRSQ